MTYAMLDDRFDENLKYLELDFKLEHFGLQACAITFCNRGLTDGQVPRSWVANKFGRRGLVLAQQFVEWGIWVTTDRGFQIVGFLDHNPSRAEVEARRALAKARKDTWKMRAAGTGKAPGSPADNSSGTRPEPANGTRSGTPPGTRSAHVPERVPNKSRARAPAGGLRSDPIQHRQDLFGAVAPEPSGPSDHQRVMACYADEYERLKGQKPGMNGRTGKAAKELLALFAVNDACAVIRGAFADEFFRKSPELWNIVSSPNRFKRLPAPSPPVTNEPVRDPVTPEDVDKALADLNETFAPSPVAGGER